jgi:pimeloyl-ACP methyl ester carboxylesterase
MRIFAFTVIITVLQCSLLLPARAERVQEHLPGNLVVNADYQPASTDKPAVLVLHGFLQTFDFLATRNLINDISDLGYTVLAPNLSLGIPNRKQSVQCNAAHTHTEQKDLAEINFWIQWLQNKGYHSVIMVGHSWGSQHSLGYMLANKNPAVTAVVAISLVRTRQKAATQKQQLQRASTYKKNHDNSLHAYELSFCREYMATPDSYISYASWTDNYVLQVLSTLKNRHVPVYVIVGGKDKRIDDRWVSAITPRVTKLIKIPNANHFFSHVSEFDLNDQLEKLLPQIGK